MPAGAEDEVAITDDKALEKALNIVEGVLKEIAERNLGPTDSVVLIMEKSVEVQKTATLTQIRNYLHPEGAERLRLLETVVSTIHEHSSEVQIACSKGLQTILASLDYEQRAALFRFMHKVQFKVASAAVQAWRACFYEVASMLDTDMTTFNVVPLALQLTQHDSSTKRVVGTKLLVKCIEAVPVLASHQPVIQGLSELSLDKSSSVRNLLATEFLVFCQHQNLCCIREQLMPPLMRLIVDEDVKVSSAAFTAVVSLCSTLEKRFVSSFLQPVLLQYVTSCPSSVQEVVVAEFGKLIWNTRASLGAGESSDAEYLLVVYLALTQSTDSNFRRECAFNFPAVVATFVEPSYRSRLEPTLKQLCSDSSWKVRKCMAAGFHELCNLFDAKWTGQLKQSFMELMGDEDVAVRELLVQHLEKIFMFFAQHLQGSARADFFAAVAPQLVHYERDIRTNWRKVERLLNPFQYFPRWFSVSQLHTLFVPILIRHLVEGASALRETVSSTLALFLRSFNTEEDKIIAVKSIRRLSVDVGQSLSAAGRIAYVALCEQMMSRFSLALFQGYLLGPLVALQKDPVSNVRLRLARALPFLLSPPSLREWVNTHLAKVLLEDPDQEVASAARHAVSQPFAFEFDRQRDAEQLQFEGSIHSDVLKERVEKAILADKEEKERLEKQRKKAGSKSTTGGLVEKPLSPRKPAGTRKSSQSKRLSRRDSMSSRGSRHD